MMRGCYLFPGVGRGPASAQSAERAAARDLRGLDFGLRRGTGGVCG